METIFKDLKGKNVIITGGSGLLGSQIAKAFKKNKSNIFILDINKPKKKLIISNFLNVILQMKLK